MHYSLNRMRQRSAIFWRFLLIKKTFRPNSIVEIIIKATVFLFEKIPKTVYLHSTESGRKVQNFGNFLLIKSPLCFFALLQFFAVPCGPLQYLVRSQ